MPYGKRSGEKCLQLTEEDRCAIFGSPERPKCCGGLSPSEEMCGESRGEALEYLYELERLTSP